jgi:hypothetical protein
MEMSMKVSQGAASNGYHTLTSQLGPVERRSYPLKRWAKRLYLLVGVACVVLGSFLVVHAMTQPWQSSVGVRTGAVGLVLMGVYLCLSAFVYRVVLDRDSVMVKGVFRTRTLRLNEVKGRRTFSDRHGEYTVLEAKEPEGKTLAFSNYFDLDQEWFDWIESISDLDAENDLQGCK